MRWRWLALWLGAAMLLAAAELALRARYRRRVLPATPPAPGVTLVTLGDSIAAGAPGDPQAAWPAGLLAHLRNSYPDTAWRMVNAGANGETAPLGYARFDRDVAVHRPDAVLIAFGLNDCNLARHALDRWYERRVPTGIARSYLWRAAAAHVERWGRRFGWLAEPAPEADRQLAPRTTPAGFVAALAALIDRSRDIAARPALLTMTPLAAAAAPDASIRAEVCAGYDELIRAAARKRRVPLVDLAAAHGVILPADAFEADGIHLTAAGQGWVAEHVYIALAADGFWATLARLRQAEPQR